MIWLAFFLILQPIYADNLTAVLENKAALPGICETSLKEGILSPSSLIDKLGINASEGLYLFGYCVGLKINQGILDATNGTIPESYLPNFEGKIQ